MRAANEKNLNFGGPLGSYRYCDMRQAIGVALKAFEAVMVPRFAAGAMSQ